MAQDGEETIGQRIARYRKIEGWSAQRLADESGLTRSVVTNIENGRRSDLTVSELLAVADALGLPPTAILLDLRRPWRPSNIGRGLVSRSVSDGKENIVTRPLTVKESLRWMAIPGYYEGLFPHSKAFDELSRQLDASRRYIRARTALVSLQKQRENTHPDGDPEYGAAILDAWDAYRAARALGVEPGPEPPVSEASAANFLSVHDVTTDDLREWGILEADETYGIESLSDEIAERENWSVIDDVSDRGLDLFAHVMFGVGGSS
jgi:transcriptional regulator with XRE-family HTH domain